MIFRRPYLALFATTVLLQTTSLQASPLEDPSYGGSVFTGPTNPHPTSVHVNPAAMGRASEGAHLYLGGTLRLDQYRINRQILRSVDGELEPGATVTETPVTPGGMLAYYQGFEDATVGVAFAIPFAERFIANQEELRYHTRGGSYYQFSTSLFGSYQVDRFIFGVSVSLGVTSMAYRFDRDTALDHGSDDPLTCNGSPCGIENPAAQQNIDLDVNTKGLNPLGLEVLALSNISFGLGTLIKLGNDWWIGLSYLRLLSKQELVGTVGVTEPNGTKHTGFAEVQLDLPQVFYIGLRAPVMRDYDLLLDARWQHFSTHKDLDIRIFGPEIQNANVPEVLTRHRGFRNVWRLSVGLERLPTNRLRFGGRFRVENGTVQNNTISPVQVAGTNLTGALGMEWQFTKSWGIQLGYDLTWFPEATVNDSAFNPADQIRCIDSGFALDSCRASADGRALPTAAGDYGRWQHAFLLAFRYGAL